MPGVNDQISFADAVLQTTGAPFGPPPEHDEETIARLTIVVLFSVVTTDAADSPPLVSLDHIVVPGIEALAEPHPAQTNTATSARQLTMDFIL